MVLKNEVENPKRINFFGKAFDYFEYYFAAICLIVGWVLCFIQVVSRYIFNFAVPWSEEIARWALVWLTFVGSAYAFKIDAHIGIEAFINILPSKIKILIGWLDEGLSIFFLLIMTVYGILFFRESLLIGQISPASKLPMAILYAALPVGLTLCIIRLVVKSISKVRNRKLKKG